jgi:hypothetical protein
MLNVFINLSGIYYQEKDDMFLRRTIGNQTIITMRYVLKIMWRERIILNFGPCCVFLDKHIQVGQLVRIYVAELNTQLPHFKSTERDKIIYMDI